MMPKKSSESVFHQALAQLNPEQLHAVETIEGPVMVVAGPGTGKTQVLALRIANILEKTDTAPSAILALTFTEAAAKNMRQRLTQLIGAAAYQIRIETFHAFCDDVIRTHPEYFALSRESQVASDIDRHHLMEELLTSQHLQVLRSLNSPLHFLKQILKAISDLKREGITEVQFAELVAEQPQPEAKQDRLLKNCQKMHELSLLYTEYQQRLRATNRYDYDDMIAFVAEAFRTQPELLAEYQENIAYFLVDEYQDTNSAQNGVVDLLASYWGDQANLFVVGDPHQSIYRFQGASLENTLGFMARYPTAEVIRLRVGYRCPQPIYDAAAALIAHNDVGSAGDEVKQNWLTQLAEPLQATSIEQSDGNAIQMLTAASADQEVATIATMIEELQSRSVALSDIAILTRTNLEAIPYANALNKLGIATLIEGGSNVLEHPLVSQLLELWQVIAAVRAGSDDEHIFTVFAAPWWSEKYALPRQLLWQITRAAGKTGKSLLEIIEQGGDQLNATLGTSVSPQEFEVAARLVDQLRVWGQRDAQLTFPAWCEEVLNQSGFLSWLAHHPERHAFIPLINALYREINAFAKEQHDVHLADFLAMIATMQVNGLGITVETPPLSTQAVTLATVHKAKGREWQYVFVVGCVDGKWGNARKSAALPLPEGILTHTNPAELDDRNADDRRLLYVALTRAKRCVTLSYPEKVMSGSRERVLLGSMFLSELPNDLITPIPPANSTGSGQEIQADELSLRLLQPAPPQDFSITEIAWLTSLVEDFALSVTALNTYLRSPQEFFMTVLLRLPKAKPAYFSFGTAMHAALETMYRPLLQGQPVSPLSEVQEKFANVLRSEGLLASEFELRLKYGREVLDAFYENGRKELAQPIAIEQFFGKGPHQTALGDIRLTGRIDRMDMVDADLRTIRVIDYKTGRAKTINQIEGKVNTDEFSPRELALPEPIRGYYKRQLLFYKLLTQLDPHFAGTVTEGTFIFVEPTETGKITQRTFALPDEEVELLKDLIREVMTEIRALKFIATTAT